MSVCFYPHLLEEMKYTTFAKKLYDSKVQLYILMLLFIPFELSSGEW